MSKASFKDWLRAESWTARSALLSLYERRDRALYVEAPAVRQEYMEKVGFFEERVLEAELSVVLLEKKASLLQAAVNRRARADLAEIDRQLEAFRQELLAREEKKDASLVPLPLLSPEETKELQTLYHEVLRGYHPAAHPDLTDAERRLYDAAVDAYRRQNLPALRLACEMLREQDDASGGGALTLSLTMKRAAGGASRDENAESSLDYGLAKRLYACFAPMQAEELLRASLNRSARALDEATAEFARIQDAFPLSARALLADPARAAEYMEDLRARLRRSERALRDLGERVARLTAEAGA